MAIKLRNSHQLCLATQNKYEDQESPALFIDVGNDLLGIHLTGTISS